MKQENFGELIKEIRKTNNLTQKQLAEKYHITSKTVSNWENNRNVPEAALIKKIKRDFKIKANTKVETKQVINEQEIQQIAKVKTEEKVEKEVEISRVEELEIESPNVVEKKVEIEESKIEPEEIVFSTEDKEIRNKIYIVSLIALSLLIACTLSIKQPTPVHDFGYKAISNNCTESQINAESTYDSTLNVLYFSKINYCVAKNETKYKSFEGTLYAVTDITNDKEITSYSYNKNEDITLDEYLKGVTLSVDKSVCNEELYFEITATNDDAIAVYRVPIISTNNCIS